MSAERADVIRNYLAEHDAMHEEWKTELETAFTEHDTELQEMFRNRGREIEAVFTKYDELITKTRSLYMERCQKASQHYQTQLDAIFTRNQKEANYNDTAIPDSDRAPASPEPRS